MGRRNLEILPIINRLSFFDSFSTNDKRQIVSDDAHFQAYTSGQTLIRQGSIERSLFIILTGTVHVTEASGETTLAVLKAGDVFGEMAFLTDTRRTATVTAIEPVIALKLDPQMFEKLSTDIREKFKDKIIEKLVARLNAANKELVRLNSAMGESSGVSSKSMMKLVASPSSSDPPEADFLAGRELIRKIIADTSSLPAMPAVMIKVQQMIGLPGTSPAQLAKIIETDPAMVAGILKVANSAYYGFRGKVSTIRHASALFGTRRLGELITAMSAGAVLGKAMDGYGLEAGDMWRHSIAVAVTAGEIAAAIASDAINSAYMAGLLHDVGKIILDPYVRERKALFDHYIANYPENSIQDAERDILGFDHAVIAGVLCENWNLPRAISFGVRHHHQPSAAGDHQLSHIVYLADYFTLKAGVVGGGKTSGREIDSHSRTLVPLDIDTLQRTAEKAGNYVKSLTGRLLGS
jgi:HD-like signal output (HDOD) protein